MNFDLDFIGLNILLLITFIIAGNNISRGMNYWRNAIWCILMFTFVQGTRFARGNDYFLYSKSFKEGNINTENPLFSLINEILKSFGINEYSCFMVYAFIFVLCAILFMQDFKRYAKYMFPLFLVGFINFEESMIRQAFSYSFFFLFLKNLLRIRMNKKVFSPNNIQFILLCIICGIITIKIHTANIINIIIILFLFLFYHKPFKPQLAIPIYIGCTYILPHIFNFSWLNPILSFAAENNERAAEYVNNSEYWFSAEGMNDIYQKNIITEFIQVVGSSSLIYLGQKLCLNLKDSPYSYILAIFLNAFIIGLCIESTFVKLEILHRIGQVLDIVGYFALTFVLYYRRSFHPTIKTKLLYFCLIWFIYYYVKYIFFSKSVLFIWDTNYHFFN